jgi:hypothetical protein
VNQVILFTVRENPVTLTERIILSPIFHSIYVIQFPHYTFFTEVLSDTESNPSLAQEWIS